MGKIYQGQTDLTIALSTKKDLTGATSLKIKFKKPDGISGEWTATTPNAVEGIIEYEVDSNDVDTVGKWTVWAKIIDVGGLISIGEPTTFQVHKEGI
jgi:hypothetical protein